ncbi:nucleotidyltransferase family protein [Alteromonas sp. C1M14]|uniref:nucleotidyltransferase family protein n=1 Tax=Alteromonas sp. C1M14 TaxID=2841567 RepID=UPI001C08BFB1|nr:nucleotidyltransferase family protein [Alteromonas sp. C1M14]MBU2976770.1 nucleotidyltransferase family protein [Alteromonas sp. C1M14]
MSIKLAAVILAGGESVRYQGNKLLSRHPSGNALINYVLKQYAPLCAVPPIVVTGRYHDRLQTGLSHENCTIVHNAQWSLGMGSSIARGVKAIMTVDADSRPSHVIVGTGDGAAITTHSIYGLVEQLKQTPNLRVASVVMGRRMSPAIFPAKDFSKLAALAGEKGAAPLLQSPSECIGVDHPQARWDIDTPEDWLKIPS